MAKYPNIEVLKAMSGKWEPQTAAANVQQLLVANPDVDAIFVDSDWLASGIVANLEASGGKYGKRGDPNHIFFVGINGAPEAHQYIRDGWMDLTLSTPVPDLTGAAVDMAMMLIKGEPLPAEYVQEGAAWSPAKIYTTPIYGDVHFPKEETKSTLGRQVVRRKLRVYAGADHPHVAQQPTALTFSSKRE